MLCSTKDDQSPIHDAVTDPPDNNRHASGRRECFPRKEVERMVGFDFGRQLNWKSQEFEDARVKVDLPFDQADI